MSNLATMTLEELGARIGLCACGRPLHYSSWPAYSAARKLVREKGDTIIVTVTGGGRYRVQRHYIALHGLRAIDLPELARKGIVEGLPEFFEA